MTTDTTASRHLALAAASAAAAKQAEDIEILAVGDLLAVTDFFVLVSASNPRLLGTVVEEVEGRLRLAEDRRPRRREGTADAGWIVLDYGDVVVHAFDRERRAFYGLERLWADAPRVPYAEPAATRSTR